MENQNEVSKKNNGWGGARKGSGRPKGRISSKTVCIRVPEDIDLILAKQANRTAFIIEAIREYARQIK